MKSYIKQQQPLSSHKVAAKCLSDTQKQQEPEKRAEFSSNLKQVGGRSLWLSMVFIFMSAPSFCHVMLYTAFAKISTCDFKTRCRIPELENTNWTFEEIHYISSPANDRNQNCTYYLYNYSTLATMEYIDALNYVDNIKLPKVSSCRKYVHKGCEIYSVYEEFSLVCKRAVYDKILNISPVYGEIIGRILLVPLADLLGRKRVIAWGTNFFTAGALLMCLGRSVEFIIFGRILVGMAYVTMIHPIQAIVVEISNAQLRPFRFIATNMGIGLGFVAIPLLATKIANWRHLQWTVCGSLLVLPLITWYIPESPRWLMFKGKKAKAWAMLRTMKDPATQSELLLSYRNEKTNYVKEMKEHVKEFKPFVTSKLLFLTLLFFLVGGVYFKNFSGRFQMKFFTSRPVYLILSGIAETFGCMFCIPSLVIFGRKATLGFLFLCGGISYLVASGLEMGTLESLICLLTMEISTAAVYAAVYLYTAENVPTSHRCTATGISSGLGAGLSTVIMFHNYYYFLTDQILFVVLGSMCLTGVIISFFAQESKKEICDTVEETTRPHIN